MNEKVLTQISRANAKRFKSLNPQPGERYEGHDGGTIYVRDRSVSLVLIQRRPLGDSEAMPRWVRLATFEKLAKEKLNA